MRAYALCLLDNCRNPIKYYMALPLRSKYDTKIFKYIGLGRVYSIEGIRQPGRTRLMFFRLNPNRARWAR